MFFVTGQKRTDRLTICQGCEHFVQSTKSCGPLITEAFTDSKALRLPYAHKDEVKGSLLPLGKWEAEISAEFLDKVRELIDNPRNATNGDLAELYSKATGTNTKASQCSSCNRRMLNELKQLLKDATT